LVMLKRLVSVFALFSKDFFPGEVTEKRSETINKRSLSTSDRLRAMEHLKPENERSKELAQ